MEQIKEMMIDYWTQQDLDFSALRQRSYPAKKAIFGLQELGAILAKEGKAAHSGHRHRNRLLPFCWPPVATRSPASI